MNRRQHAGGIEVTFRYSRHVGPTFVHGGVTLQFDSTQPYAFVSHARWPSTDNYEDAVREAVEQALRERQGNLRSTLVTLTEIEWHEIYSSKLGFQRAAAAATRAAFEV